jgi:hypothetical protein
VLYGSLFEFTPTHKLWLAMLTLVLAILVPAGVADLNGTGYPDGIAAEDIPLEYTLHEGDAGWLIINILADGVSDLALKRAEFQRVLAGGTIGDLVRHLEEQTARMAAGR